MKKIIFILIFNLILILPFSVNASTIDIKNGSVFTNILNFENLFKLDREKIGSYICNDHNTGCSYFYSTNYIKLIIIDSSTDTNVKFIVYYVPKAYDTCVLKISTNTANYSEYRCNITYINPAYYNTFIYDYIDDNFSNLLYLQSSLNNFQFQLRQTKIDNVLQNDFVLEKFIFYSEISFIIDDYELSYNNKPLSKAWSPYNPYLIAEQSHDSGKIEFDESIDTIVELYREYITCIGKIIYGNILILSSIGVLLLLFILLIVKRLLKGV